MDVKSRVYAKNERRAIVSDSDLQRGEQNSLRKMQRHRAGGPEDREKVVT